MIFISLWSGLLLLTGLWISCNHVINWPTLLYLQYHLLHYHVKMAEQKELTTIKATVIVLSVSLKTVLNFYLLYTHLLPTPPTNTKGVGVYLNHSVHLSVCHPICVSDRVCVISPKLLKHFYFCFTKLCMVVNYHEVECHEEKLVHCPQCQGHSEGLCNQNIISFISFKLLVCLQPKWFNSIVS